MLIIGDAQRYLHRFSDAVESYLLAIAKDKNKSIGYEKLSMNYLNLNYHFLPRRIFTPDNNINSFTNTRIKYTKPSTVRGI